MSAFAAWYVTKCLAAWIAGYTVGAVHRTLVRGLSDAAR